MSVIKFIFVLLILIPVALLMLYLLNSLMDDIPDKEAYQEERRSGGRSKSKGRSKAKKRSSASRPGREEYQRSSSNNYYSPTKSMGTLHRSKPMREMNHPSEPVSDMREKPSKRRKKRRSKR